MAGWSVTENEIQEIERILLPDECHFADDAKTVIRCWESTDVSACPGSGKTTVLLAKLKILADKMPLNNGAGVCVLSHTNVAVDEIKKHLSDCADKLMSYPNYIGTIQSFVDRFVTMPYIRKKYGRSVQPVDDQIYAEHLLRVVCSGRYKKLYIFIKSHYSGSAAVYKDQVDFIKALSLDAGGNLLLQGKKIAGCHTDSAKLYYSAKLEVLISEGLIRYGDTYPFAREAIEMLGDEFAKLCSYRFRFAFIDEYQDCNDEQRDALSCIFDPLLCTVMRIGDPDQAIYSFQEDSIIDWVPDEGRLSIDSTCRYPQEIADVLSPLRKEKALIQSMTGNFGYKPVLIVFNDQSIDKVLTQFITQLESKGLHDPNGDYYAVGFVGKETTSGLKIGSYWAGYDSKSKSKSDYRYWALIEEICESLQSGKLYRAESSLRKLICKIFHFAGVTNKNTGKEFTQSSIKNRLKSAEYCDIYSNHVIEFAELQKIDRNTIDDVFKKMMAALLQGEENRVFSAIPAWFLDESVVCKTAVHEENNVFIDPIRGRNIRFCTIHSVKGQTHDATLYLETEKSRGSDLGRMLWCYGIEKPGQSSLYDYSRKLTYVGFSRPRRLLCVAMQEKTYEKCKNKFQNQYWEVADIRE